MIFLVNVDGVSKFGSANVRWQDETRDPRGIGRYGHGGSSIVSELSSLRPNKSSCVVVELLGVELVTLDNLSSDANMPSRSWLAELGNLTANSNANPLDCLLQERC